MRRLRPVPPAPLTIVLSVLLVSFGCAAQKTTASSSVAGETKAPLALGTPLAEVDVKLALSPGQSWKSRFVSTSEVTRTLTRADGKPSVKSRSVGLELIAAQTVTSVAGTVATIEVRESSVRILQEGKFLDAPFRQFHPPNPVSFTVDTATGALDFAPMEKAYAGWMAAVRSGPVGEIIGKTFRLEAYVGQLRERYGKPFARFAGKKLSRESRTQGEREFILPFLGPGVALGPIPVETTSRIEGMEVRGGERVLAASGSYAGKGELAPAELAARLADFGMAAPAAYTSSEEARGDFRSDVDLRSGREIRSTSRLAYSTTASFDGATLAEEILGKAVLEPVE